MEDFTIGIHEKKRGGEGLRESLCGRGKGKERERGQLYMPFLRKK